MNIKYTTIFMMNSNAWEYVTGLILRKMFLWPPTRTCLRDLKDSKDTLVLHKFHVIHLALNSSPVKDVIL